MMIEPLRPDTKSMEMTLQEYCSWYLHMEELNEIFGLGGIILPPLSEILESAISKEGYEQLSLYALLAEDNVDKEEFLKVIKGLHIDLSFPDLRLTANTVCRWIASQEPVITKNLKTEERDLIVRSSEDYSHLQSLFAPLTNVFHLVEVEDLNNVPAHKPVYVYYFGQLIGEDKNLEDDHVREAIQEVADLNLPDEYLDIYRILFQFYAENLTVQDWIEEEARIVELAKTVYQKLTA